jgi:hypothetical protein
VREKAVAETEAVQDGEPVGLQQDAGANGTGLGDTLEQGDLRTCASEKQRSARAANPATHDHDSVARET